MLVLSRVARQLGSGEMVNAFMPIGSMELVHTSLGKLANALKTLNKMLSLHVHACLSFVCVGAVLFLYPYAKLVFYIFVLLASYTPSLALRPRRVGRRLKIRH